MPTALQRYRHHAESTYTKYDGHLAAVADCDYDDDTVTIGDQYYGLQHYRRCSIIRLIDSQGFHYAEEYPDADTAQAELDKIRDDFNAECEAEALAECPDAWRVVVSRHSGDSEKIDADDADDARYQASRLLRKARRQERIVWTLAPGRSWEIADPGDSLSLSYLAGIISIDHVDRSEDRADLVEQLQCY